MQLFIELAGEHHPLDCPLPQGLIQEASRYPIHWTEDNREAKDEDYELIVSGIPINMTMFSNTNSSVKIKWNWEPEFFSGTFFPELFFKGLRIWPIEKLGCALTVDPDCKKLTQQQYCLMLENVARISQILYSLSPAFKNTRLGRGGKKSPLAQLELLLLYMEQIVLAVEQIAKNPKKKLESFRREVPLYQSSQIDEQSIIRLVHHPEKFIQVKKVPQSLDKLAAMTKNYLFESVNEVTKLISYNTYENAFVKGFLQKILRIIHGLERQLLSAISASAQDLVKRSVAERKLLLLRECRKNIQGCLKLSFLEQVEPATKLDKVTVTMTKHLGYRRLHQYYLKFLLGLTPVGQENLDLSLERTYQLYEYWCFLKIVEYLVKRHKVEEVDVSGLFTITGEHGGISLRLKHGKESAVTVDERLNVYFQRQYNHHPINHQPGVGSYSFKMIPDIVLEKEEEDGLIKTILLDPKYRVGEKSIKEALGDMHKYKDALIDGNGNKIISAAFILVPNSPTDADIVARYCPWDYKVRHGFGVCMLTPGDESNLYDLNELLTEFGI